MYYWFFEYKWHREKYGFEIIEILDVAHGSMHNDTLVTVELKEK